MLSYTYSWRYNFTTPTQPPPLAAIDADGYCRRSNASTCPSVWDSVSLRPSVRPERRYHSNSLRIAAIRLKFGEVVQSIMMQIAVYNIHTLPIFASFTELWKFHDRLDQAWGTTLPLYLFKDFSYWPAIWWGDVQYYGTDRNIKCPCLAIFCASHGYLKLPWQAQTRSDR